MTKTQPDNLTNPEIGEMLQAMVKSYRDKAPENLSLEVGFEFGPDFPKWHIVISPGRQVTLHEGFGNSPDFTFITDKNTLRLIFEGKLSALTAASKASASDRSPLDIIFPDGFEFTPANRELFLGFIQRFFNRALAEKTLLGEEYSRMIHGGHAIPINYHPGFRSAWYLVKKGERINDPGDTNPYPQSIIIISGAGTAKIGDNTVAIAANETYYIPPHSDHVIWTESDEPLVLIWLAWGEGA